MPALIFSTGNPDGRLGAASRPASAGVVEVESADDFVLTSPTLLTGATFTGLITGGGSIGQVGVEFYRVFPVDSDVGRTSGPPTFSTAEVPTRVNSPSDVEFVGRDTTASNLTFSSSVITATFTASNSISATGIHALPVTVTGGNGAVTGAEVQFTVTFTNPVLLPADHYFFIPQVAVTGGDFYWLSAPRPIVAPGTAFPAGSTDLQAWIRNANLDPDWLRMGTDIIGGSPAPTFNMTFALVGTEVPEPSTFWMLGFALVMGGAVARRKLQLG